MEGPRARVRYGCSFPCTQKYQFFSRTKKTLMVGASNPIQQLVIVKQTYGLLDDSTHGS